MPTFTSITDVAALSENSLKEVEHRFSIKLPDDYRNFLLEHNGGFPSPDCVTFTEAGRKTASDVFCFLAIGDERDWASLEWNHDAYSGRLPQKTVPIARDSCGNLWLLSVEREHPGSVFFWDHGSYDNFDETGTHNLPLVAASFREFLDNLRIYDGSVEDGVVLSRYALVKMATDSISRNDTGFAQENPGFVWHCDCRDDGSAKMQFVPYVIHAITHTDGYSRLRAIKGLIKEGPWRLPE